MFHQVLLISWLILSFLATPAHSRSSKIESFSVGVRDSLMIAHSFKGEEFGPAQNLHGATFTVDVDFSSSELVDKCNWVIDIAKASNVLQEVLAKYHMKNLDEIFPGENTTTEFMCRAIHADIAEKLAQKSKSEGASFRGGLNVKM